MIDMNIRLSGQRIKLQVRWIQYKKVDFLTLSQAEKHLIETLVHKESGLRHRKLAGLHPADLIGITFILAVMASKSGGCSAAMAEADYLEPQSFTGNL
jgi:hypothetical protein